LPCCLIRAVTTVRHAHNIMKTCSSSQLLLSGSTYKRRAATSHLTSRRPCGPLAPRSPHRSFHRSSVSGPLVPPSNELADKMQSLLRILAFFLLSSIALVAVSATPASGSHSGSGFTRRSLVPRSGTNSRTISSHVVPRTNAERLANGMSPLKPRQLFSPSRGFALPMPVDDAVT
jgi:hypothetical protein